MKRSFTSRPALGSPSLAAGKENSIQDLKQEIFELKDLEYDLFRLNDEITSIQAKYGAVLDQKDRSETVLKTKLAISKNNIQVLQTDVDQIKTQIDTTAMDAANFMRDNVTLQRNTQNKENQVNNLILAVKELEKTNEIKASEMQDQEAMFGKVKATKGKLEEEVDKLDRKYQENVQVSKELDRQIKNQVVTEKSLSVTFEKLKEQGQQLETQMRVRENVLKETSQHYEVLTVQTTEAQELNKKLDKESKNLEQNIEEVTRSLEHTQKMNNQKEGKLRELQDSIVKADLEYNKVVIKKEGLLKDHTDLATTNKDLNLEIDQCLMKILQLEAVNKVLQKQIENYIDCDEEARLILDRKQKMSELLQTVSSKLSRTESAIAHLI